MAREKITALSPCFKPPCSSASSCWSLMIVIINVMLIIVIIDIYQFKDSLVLIHMIWVLILWSFIFLWVLLHYIIFHWFIWRSGKSFYKLGASCALRHSCFRSFEKKISRNFPKPIAKFSVCLVSGRFLFLCTDLIHLLDIHPESYSELLLNRAQYSIYISAGMTQISPWIFFLIIFDCIFSFFPYGLSLTLGAAIWTHWSINNWSVSTKVDRRHRDEGCTQKKKNLEHNIHCVKRREWGEDTGFCPWWP